MIAKLTNTLKDSALQYLGYGFSVIPLQNHSKIPALTTWEEFKWRKPRNSEIESWWSKYSQKNLAIVTGRLSGVIVIDIDYPIQLEKAIKLGLPETWCVKTYRGRQYYFQHPPFDIGKLRIGVHDIEVLGEGAYAVAPPSMHPNGKQYKWIVSPHDAELASIPDWIEDQIKDKLLIDDLRREKAKPLIEVCYGTN
jgi:hypothetical protein